MGNSNVCVATLGPWWLWDSLGLIFMIIICPNQYWDFIVYSIINYYRFGLRRGANVLCMETECALSLVESVFL